MTTNIWARTDRLMRTLHLYTGLFLVPWIIVYAASAFMLNHHKLIADAVGLEPPKWSVQKRLDFTPPDDFPSEPEAQAQAILNMLDLDGPHRFQGKPLPRGFTVFRISGGGNYRIRWERPRRQVIVERQAPFSALRFVNYLHFRCGFQQPYLSLRAWAVVVDVVVFSMLLWVFSGVYIWWRMPRRRRWGLFWFLAGVLLFVGLVALLLM